MRRYCIIVLCAVLGVALAFLAGLASHEWISRIARVVIAPKAYSADELPIVKTGLSSSQRDSLANTIKITYVGDMCLLRDAIEVAHDTKTGEYNFDDVFKHVKNLWQNDDLTIGVLEGPFAGDKVPYSTTDLYDDNPVYLNFPDSFASSIKSAGMDLVTTANNHVLDHEFSGAVRTLQILDKYDIKHVGSYKSRNESELPYIINIYGKRVALLSYTYGVNYKDDAYFFNGDTNFVTKVCVEVDSPFLTQNLHLVERDFARVMAMNPDCVVVLAHLGTEFSHMPDRTQKFWCDRFISLGADIVLSAHAHVVQPVVWRQVDGSKLIVYGPGNFISTYYERDGYATMMCEIYLSRSTGKPVAASCMPMYQYCHKDGGYTAIPVHDAINDYDFLSKMNKSEKKLAQNAQRIVSRIVSGKNIPFGVDIERFWILPHDLSFSDETL